MVGRNRNMDCFAVETEQDMKDYENYVLRQDCASFNSSLKFRDFLIQLMEYQFTPPLYLMAKEEGKVIGVLPSFAIKGKYGTVLNSMPWFGSNPGIYADNIEARTLLIDEFYKMGKWLDCISATFISKPVKVAYNMEGFLFDERIGMVTELDQSLMVKFHSKTRNQIRKSYLQNWFQVADVHNAKDIMVWLALVHQKNMKAVGAPVKCREFDVLLDNFKLGTDYRLYFAKDKETREVSAALLLKYYNKTVDYMTPAINSEYRDKCPLHILIFEAMKDAAQRGIKYWNWGGTTLPGMEGVYHFKKRFGADEFKYFYHTKIYDRFPWQVTKEEWLKEYKYFFVIPFKELRVMKGK